MPLRTALRRNTIPRSRLGTACVITVGLAVLSPATASTAATSGPGEDRGLQRQIEDFVHSPGGPPGIIAVLRRGNDTRVLRAGVADLDTRRRPQPDAGRRN